MELGMVFSTALGPMRLHWSETGIRCLEFTGRFMQGSQEGPPWVMEAARHLTQYLDGRAAPLTEIPLDLEGHSPFRRRVAEVLLGTRPGQTLTYGEVALLAGSPGAARAVGQAVARNPLPILVPCHRVLASHGPGGFSLFGSLATKARLLALEGVQLRHT